MIGRTVSYRSRDVMHRLYKSLVRKFAVEDDEAGTLSVYQSANTEGSCIQALSGKKGRPKWNYAAPLLQAHTQSAQV